MKNSLYQVSALLVLFVLSGCAQEAGDENVAEAPNQALADAPDQILTNAKILTVDNDFSIVEAIAIEGDRILATGSTEDMLVLAGPDTEVTDLQGRTVVPGLIDNHVHYIRTVPRWHQQARIDGVNSREEALNILAEHAASLQPGEWFMVQGGWSEEQFTDQPGGFSLEELDRVSPNNPMYMQRTYGTSYANSLALQATGVPLENGSMQRGRGPFTQMFNLMPEPSEEQMIENLYQFSLDVAAAGMTTAYDVGRLGNGDISLIEKASAEKPLPIRVFHTLRYRAETDEEADESIEFILDHAPFSMDDRKGLLGLGEHVYGPMHDGAGTAESYPDEIWDPFMKLAAVAAEEGWHIHEHTMAEVTVSDFLDRLEILNETTPIDDLRWTLAHVLTVTEDTLVRARDLGLTIAVHGQAAHQPRPIIPRGDAEAPPIPLLSALEDNGIVWGLGSDTGVVSHYQPFVTIMWAATGLGIDGTQIQPNPVGREAALVAHTRSNAYMMFLEEDLGSLEPGKLADLVVLDRDYLTIPGHEIKDIQSVATMVGGEIVYGEI